MSAAAVEHPCDGPERNLLEEAERLSAMLPGYRVEIIGGEITVTPPPDMPHAEALSDLMLPFFAAGLHGEQTRVIQSGGVWLPDGPSDYAIPDLAVVDADYRDHSIEHNCYDPAIFPSGPGGHLQQPRQRLEDEGRRLRDRQAPRLRDRQPFEAAHSRPDGPVRQRIQPPPRMRPG